MTKVKKLLKKAFTLVELVVVVAIIAILSGVSVAAYVGITDRANKAADQETVAQLNLQLAAQEAIEGKNKTCFDAIVDCYSTGLNLEELTPSTKNSQYVWDQDNDRFAILNDDLEVVAEDSTFELTSNKLHRWILSNTYSVNADGNSVYLLAGYNGETISNVSTGLDTGINSGIKEINYVQPKRATEGDIVIRTNTVDSKLTIDASDVSVSTANVQHYGICGIVESVKTASTNKYIENGKVALMTLDEGNAQFANKSSVYNLMHTKGKNPQITVDSLANVYDFTGLKSRWIAENFNSDTGNKYTKDINLKSVCGHEYYETIIDSKGVYQICKCCGLSLVNKFNPDFKYMQKFATAQVTSPATYYSPIFKQLSTVTSGGWTLNYDYLTTTSSSKGITTTISQPALTEEQTYCSHDSFTYLHDSTGSNYYHVCRCDECGYEFKDAHIGLLQCEECNEQLHEWGENHKCKLHGESATRNFTYTYGDFNCEVSICGSSIAVWGMNDENKYGIYAKNLSTGDYNMALMQILSKNLGSFTLFQAYGQTGLKLQVQVMNATYLPQCFADMASEGNRVLSNIILPETLEEIGYQGLMRTLGVKTLTIPHKVTKIGKNVFWNSGVRSIVVPKSVKVLDEHFCNICPNLSTVVLPEGLTTINAHAFDKCPSLESLTIPSTVTYLNTYLFLDANNPKADNPFYLKELKYNGTVAQWNKIIFREMHNWDVKEKTFINAPAGFKVQCLDGEVSVSSK